MPATRGMPSEDGCLSTPVSTEESPEAPRRRRRPIRRSVRLSGAARARALCSAFLRDKLATFPQPSQKRHCVPGKAASSPTSREELLGVYSGRPSPCAPEERRGCGPGLANAHSQRKRIKTHSHILRLQGLNALGHIPVIDVTAIHFHEMVQGRDLVPCSLVRRSQLIVQSGAGIRIDGGQLERLFIPANGRFRNALIEEALGQ